jgi:hypothetical protein
VPAYWNLGEWVAAYATIFPFTIQPTGQPTAPSLHAVRIDRRESVKIEKNKKVLLAGRLKTYQNMIFGKYLARKNGKL